MTVTKPRSLFGHQLRRELDRQNVSIRELARRMHSANGAKWKDAKTARRSLARWLAGNGATDANRRECAAALGLDAAHFLSADDDEEEAELFATLTDALMAVVQRQVERVAHEEVP